MPDTEEKNDLVTRPLASSVDTVLNVAKTAWLFSLLKVGADELGVEESRFDSNEWVDLEIALYKLDLLSLETYEAVFDELRSKLHALISEDRK